MDIPSDGSISLPRGAASGNAGTTYRTRQWRVNHLRSVRRDARRAVLTAQPVVDGAADEAARTPPYGHIKTTVDGYLTLLEAIRAGREPDEVEIRKLDEEEARWKVKRRPSPRRGAEGG